MNILLSTDNNFVQHCCVTMTSVLMNNTDVTFFLFTEGLSATNEAILRNQVKKYGGTLEVVEIHNDKIRSFPMPPNAGDHISLATYYRLFAEMILPADMNKILYLDCDMVINSDLSELWNTDLEDYAIGAVYQKVTDSQIYDLNRLRIPSDYGYFNAGTLLINLDYWRKYNVTEQLFAFIEKHFDLIKQHDQDTLNAVLYDKTLPLSYKWNFSIGYLDVKNAIFPSHVDYSAGIDAPAIIHFVSAPKPWDFGCEHPQKELYYKYLERTTFKGFKPKFVWKKYRKDVLANKIVKMIVFMDVFDIRKKYRNLFPRK